MLYRRSISTPRMQNALHKWTSPHRSPPCWSRRLVGTCAGVCHLKLPLSTILRVFPMIQSALSCETCVQTTEWWEHFQETQGSRPCILWRIPCRCGVIWPFPLPSSHCTLGLTWSFLSIPINHDISFSQQVRMFKKCWHLVVSSSKRSVPNEIISWICVYSAYFATYVREFPMDVSPPC